MTLSFLHPLWWKQPSQRDSTQSSLYTGPGTAPRSWSSCCPSQSTSVLSCLVQTSKHWYLFRRKRSLYNTIPWTSQECLRIREYAHVLRSMVEFVTSCSLNMSVDRCVYQRQTTTIRSTNDWDVRKLLFTQCTWQSTIAVIHYVSSLELASSPKMSIRSSSPAYQW